MTEAGVFNRALKRCNDGHPPIWMMRQAGRYHAHYQALRRDHGFVELCKNPDLAAEVAMGPVRDFGFDAAILFSDILFPLEAMGPSLVFDPGPKLGYLLQHKDDLSRYSVGPETYKHMQFQADALRKTRARLPDDKALIGFVGGPLTLYVFAVHGSHKADLTSARDGLRDGRFDGFMQKLKPLLLENMALQAETGCDALAVFESCAGDIIADDFVQAYLPHLRDILQRFAARYPHIPLIYYGKNIGPAHWAHLVDLPITVLGIDHHQNLPQAFAQFGDRFVLQGNFDPDHLTLPQSEFETQLKKFLSDMDGVSLPHRRGWICGLGHGVTPYAREENVRRFITNVRNHDFSERVAA